MQRVLLAIPRDHAKTTLSKLAVVWYFRYTNHRFCVYLSNTNTIAKNACKDIIGYLKSPNSIAVFGEIKMIKESETDSLWIFELTTPAGRVKTCILRAVGAGQQMRGINIDRSEEHKSELQSLMRTSYAVFCLKKKKQNQIDVKHTQNTTTK